MKNINRVLAEIELLSSHFGDVEYDDSNPCYAKIISFPLPCGFNKPFCVALFDLADDYPEHPVRDFYLESGLRKYGEISEHYFEDGFSHKRYRQDGFAWYSLHLKRWKPDPYSMIVGDNLLTAADSLYEALKTD